MDKRYESFCTSDPLFYESRATASVNGAAPRFAAAARQLPSGWRRFERGEWLAYEPPALELPAQGWKIHVSARAADAEAAIEIVQGYCVGHRLPFKFLNGPLALHLRNAKYASRGASGKLLTVYPADEACLRSALRDLDELLRGVSGPYVLSDLRYGTGPVYVRYGGFAEQHCVDADGELVPAITGPAGDLVPDRREPGGYRPAWVPLPDFLAPHAAARDAVTLADLPYRVERALHFSNGGGVYEAVDVRDGTRVVLKEARPHAGLAMDGADAVTRLVHEADMLRRLAGLAAAPEVLDELVVGDHRFLVLEHVDGRTLNTFFAERHPLIDIEPDDAALADYSGWAMRIYRAVERALASIHERGVVINDLHMFNIIVRPDESVTFVDFEIAAPAGARGARTVAHPGFVAPPDRTGVDVDRYALACLKLAMFMPMTTLFLVDRAKARHLAAVAAARFPLPSGFFDDAVREIIRDQDPDAGVAPGRGLPGTGDWPAASASMARAVLASATPARQDRLYPGDVEQFRSGGTGLAFGAAGVLYALAAAGHEPPAEHVAWLRDRATGEGSGLGFYTGAHGVAYALAALGHRQAALDTVATCLRERWDRLGHDLYGGLAGVGLNLAHLAAETGETGLAAAALRAGERLAERYDRPSGDGTDPAMRPRLAAGLMRGDTGPALLFLRLREQTGDERWLDLAATALRRDLARCVPGREGALKVDEGHRVLPYLASGSAGIGMVTARFLALRHEPDIAAADAAIVPAARSCYYAQSGLFNGRAGLVLYLADRRELRRAASGPAADVAALDGHTVTQARLLDWHAMSYRGLLAFPGDQLMRLSMDLATGTAGCLLALAAAAGLPAAHLPLLGPAAPRSDEPAPQTGPLTAVR